MSQPLLVAAGGGRSGPGPQAPARSHRPAATGPQASAPGIGPQAPAPGAARRPGTGRGPDATKLDEA
jgi:hypothetical protein